jgi:hypothetical protein
VYQTVVQRVGHCQNPALTGVHSCPTCETKTLASQISPPAGTSRLAQTVAHLVCSARLPRVVDVTAAVRLQPHPPRSTPTTGVVQGRGNRLGVRDDELGAYFKPKRAALVTEALLPETKRGVSYTKTAPVYLFQRVPKARSTRNPGGLGVETYL